MLTFRQKIFLTYIAVFFLILAFLYPYASMTVHGLVLKSMEDRADELIPKLKTVPNSDLAIKRKMQELKPTIFFRASVISDKRKALYDTHTKRLVGGQRYSHEQVVEHPEVNEAFETGSGFSEDYSDLFHRQFAYFAKRFNFHGKPYVLRIAFPHEYIAALIEDFESGFLSISVAILLLFAVMTWLIIYRLTKPIKQIIDAVRPYQEGESAAIPEIKLKANPKDDFGRLAVTLNSLSSKVRAQIQTLTYERNEKEAVLASLVEGVVAVGGDGRVAYANNRALKFLRVQRGDLVGEPFDRIPDSGYVALMKKCLAEGAPLTETFEKRENGHHLFLDVVAAPMKQKRGSVLVIQDKSSHYRMLQMRKDFVANASHELKTPITIVRGFAEMLHENPQIAKEQVEELTAKIVKNCERMTLLIRDLLKLSDIEHLSLEELEECPLEEVAGRSVALLKEEYPDAKVEIERQGEGRFAVPGDSPLLEMAFSNLLTNSAKYSEPPAEITVRLKEDEKAVSFSVSDKGIGIPEEELENIFHRFYRSEAASTRKRSGSGLGLSLVETIVEKHGGEVFVASKLGEGSTFTLKFPKQRKEA